MTTNIMIVGVGGQGTLLASRILGNTVINEGFDVKVSEVHGMSQRGGSVVTYVKYGEEVFSPVIDKGQADIILAFEKLEAFRAMPYLKKGGKMIVNVQEIEKLKENIDVKDVDALSLAIQAGNPKAVNVVLIGVMAKSTDIPYEKWMEALKSTVPEKFLEVNVKAFDLGYKL